MARFLLAWELGAGYGHAMPLAQLAAVLLGNGHEVHLAWKDLSLVNELLPGLKTHPRLHLWQSPLWPPGPEVPPDPASFPELLQCVGFAEPGRLKGCALGWQRILDAIRPDLLVADHSPTAMLAARETPTGVAMFGNGFCIPPAHLPMPSFRDWQAVDAGRLAASEALVLAKCNEVLGALGKEPIGALRELLLVDEYFLLGWPELDHHSGLRGDRRLSSWGWPAPPRIAAAMSISSAQAGRPLLVYLRRDHPAIDVVLKVLRSVPWASLVHIAGGGDGIAGHGHGPGDDGRIAIVGRLIDLPSVLADAKLLISHAGSGTTYAALQAGIPCLMLPTQVEQLLLARRVASYGAGVSMWPAEIAARLSGAVSAMIGSPGFASAARALAQRQQIAAADVLPRIAARCEELSARGR